MANTAAQLAAAIAARSELILGGQKSGKSRRAESIAKTWLDQHPANRAVLIATALAGDGEMRVRIGRHQQSRAAQVPRMQTVEAPLLLAGAIAAQHDARTLVVVDCVTLWLTNWLMPADAAAAAATDATDDADDADDGVGGPLTTPVSAMPAIQSRNPAHPANSAEAEISCNFDQNSRFPHYLRARAAIILIAELKSESTLAPLIWVSNEIGLGVIPLGQATRQFVDELGSLNQALARASQRVVLMAAGLPLLLKGDA